jgi:Txe/YoeB family toxin of Txe-Axe toxin-antitoxin module
MEIKWTPDALEDYNYWKEKDKKRLIKLMN